MNIGSDGLRRRTGRRPGRSFSVGRTLEHLVVALVLAAMVTVVLFGVSTLRSKASLIACRSDVGAINQAVEIALIQASAGSFPTRLTDPQLRLAGRLNGVVAADGLSVAKHGYTLTYDPVLGRVDGTSDGGRTNCGF